MLAMGIQDNQFSADTKSVSVPNSLVCVDVRTSSLTRLQAKEHGSSGYEFAPKVRKPYTITKQRERWTEDEHSKFLEALQLYGRAWRRIEEHIGTKTAVQIRSHAQKFFSKVVRESASNGTGNVKPIGIPPPRPKRKPVHPYPRKMGNTPSNGNLTICKLGRSSSSLILSASEQGNGSPTSVLSAFGSDTMSSFLSNLPNQCTSPVTSAAGSSEQDTSIQEENKPAYPGHTTPALTEQKQNHSPMELELRCGGHVPPKEASPAEAPVPFLKLFGRTVMVTDSQKPSSSNVASVVPNSKSLPSVDIEKQDKSPYANLGAPPLPLLQGALHGGFLNSSKGTWSPWSGGMVPMFYPSPSNYGETMNPIEPRMMPLPWWVLCGNLPLSFLHQQNLGSRQVVNQPCAEASSDKRTKKACSWTGSNTASAAEGGHTVSSKCTEVGRSVENGDNGADKDNAALSSQRAGSDKSGKGFVPYKRCIVVERKETVSSGQE